MTTFIVGVALLALMNISFKALGPALLAGRDLPPRAARLLDALGQGLLASLVVANLLGAGWSAFDLTVVPGLAVALWLRLKNRSHLLCALSAVLITAGIRAFSWS